MDSPALQARKEKDFRKYLKSKELEDDAKRLKNKQMQPRPDGHKTRSAGAHCMSKAQGFCDTLMNLLI